MRYNNVYIDDVLHFIVIDNYSLHVGPAGVSPSARVPGGHAGYQYNSLLNVEHEVSS